MARRLLAQGKVWLSRLISRRITVVSVGAAVVYVLFFTPISIKGLFWMTTQQSVSIIAVLSRLPEAVAIVREERDRTAAERDAFGQFAQQVAALEPQTQHQMMSRENMAPAPDETGLMSHVENRPETQTNQLNAVRMAYRETVMAVPHYNEEYAESLADNMTAEFGTDVAQAVVNGDCLTPQLHQTVHQCALQERKRRADFLHQLADERNSITDTRRTFRTVQEHVDKLESSLSRRSVRELVEAWDRLENLETKCQDALSERQKHLHTTMGVVRPLALQEYLYQAKPWRYPGLNDGLNSIWLVRSAKSQVIETLENWR